MVSWCVSSLVMRMPAGWQAGGDSTAAKEAAQQRPPGVWLQRPAGRFNNFAHAKRLDVPISSDVAWAAVIPLGLRVPPAIGCVHHALAQVSHRCPARCKARRYHSRFHVTRPTST